MRSSHLHIDVGTTRSLNGLWLGARARADWLTFRQSRSHVFESNDLSIYVYVRVQDDDERALYDLNGNSDGGRAEGRAAGVADSGLTARIVLTQSLLGHFF